MKAPLLSINGSILALLILLLAGCYGSTPPVVKLGLIAPFEELYRDDGYAALHAARLAISERNAAGGVAGRPVALVALNDNARPTEASQQAGKLAVDGDVLGAVGPLHRTTAAAAGPALAAAGLPWVTLASVSPDEQPGGFALEASPAAIARAAQAMSASVVWLGDGAGGAEVARGLGPRAGLVGGPELGSQVFAGRAGAAAEGVSWLSVGPPAAGLPVEFVAAYRELAGVDPSPQAVLAYDATNLLLDAMEQASRSGAGLSRRSVLHALADLGSTGWQGLSGQVAWQSDACPPTQSCWPRLDPSVRVHRW